MNGWTTPADIRAKLQREWDKGRILAAMFGGEPVFPLRIPLRCPDARALSAHFEETRQWIASLVSQAKVETGLGFSLEWREINHRQIGRNQIPAAAVITTEGDGLALIGKRREAARFRELAAHAGAAFPQLVPWFALRPLRTLELAEEWTRLLGVLGWIKAHPRPGVYLRQLDVPGVDTKFIERHKGVLGELLDLILAPDTIETAATGVSKFEQRFGFKSRPSLIRFRMLDPSLFLHGLSDLTVTAEEFARIEPPVRRIFVTENEINGLVFPDIPRSLVIFGLGYGLDRLAETHWLHGKDIWYWGDIDTHGLAMLDQMRSRFPQARSLLMDKATLLAHQALWGKEDSPTSRELLRLTPEETELYEDLRCDRLAPSLRLEQERIGFNWVKTNLSQLINGASA